MNSTIRDQIEQINSSANKAYGNSRHFFDIGLRSYEQLLSRQFDTVTTLMDHGVAQMKLYSDAKDLREVVSGQVTLNRELADKLLNSSRELVNLSSETRDAYRAWFDAGVAEARDNMEQAVEKAAA